MGCSAHTHIEVKKDGKWFHFGAPNVKQNYILFAAMAGERLNDLRESTRNAIRPVARIHAMPNDISEVTKFCYEQDKKHYYLHNITVLEAKDLRPLQKHLDELDERRYDLEENVFYTYINDNSLASHQGWDDLRIIMWFDN